MKKVQKYRGTDAQFFLRCGLEKCLITYFFANFNTTPSNSQGPCSFFVLQNIGLTRQFECLTLLKIEVIEYGKWASNWLEMHSQT